MPTPPFFVFYGKILPIGSSSNRDGDGMAPRLRARALISLLCGLALLALWPCPRVSAGQTIPASWQPLGGPAGRISHLAGAADGRTLYAVSVTGVNRREDQTQWRERGTPARADALYVSTDSGATWQPVTNDLPPGPIAALHVEPDGSTVYVALNIAGEGQAARSGLWRSRDRGLHWAQVRLDRDDLLIRTIVRSPSGPHLFLGAVDTGPEPRSYVYRLTDGDATWRAFEVLHSADGDALRPGSVLAELVVHPAQSDTLCLTTYGGDVLISRNAGESWRQVSAGGEASGPGRGRLCPGRQRQRAAGSAAGERGYSPPDPGTQHRWRADLAVAECERIARDGRAGQPGRVARRRLSAQHECGHLSHDRRWPDLATAGRRAEQRRRGRIPVRRDFRQRGGGDRIRPVQQPGRRSLVEPPGEGRRRTARLRAC